MKNYKEMKTLYRHISTRHSSIRHGLMMLWLLLAALLTACADGSYSEEDEEPKPDNGPAVLCIYIYAPGQAVPTRANEGQVDADPEAENAINTLQIWVFTHTTSKLVTYYKKSSFMQSAENGLYTLELPIDEAYASTPVGEREHVDVYVLANVATGNCGMAFDETTPQATLESAVLSGKYFGLSETPVTEVPVDGLPMSGVLRDQPVTNEKPILTLGTSSEEMAYVKLARAVSKVRFVFSCSEDFDGLKIVSIKFDEGKIPNEEYLFLSDPNNPYDYDQNRTNIKTSEGYNAAEISLSLPVFESVICADPAYYAWDRFVNDADKGWTPQKRAEEYEALINEGVTTTYEGEEHPRLTERRVYLRESDKRLSGTITYQFKEKDADDWDDKTVPFSMVTSSDEDTTPYFSRNHTWIVYSYLAWAKMNIVAVHINDWEKAVEGEHTLYNW